jgi:hypothetical protein
MTDSPAARLDSGRTIYRYYIDGKTNRRPSTNFLFITIKDDPCKVERHAEELLCGVWL